MSFVSCDCSSKDKSGLQFADIKFTIKKKTQNSKQMIKICRDCYAERKLCGKKDHPAHGFQTQMGVRQRKY